MIKSDESFEVNGQLRDAVELTHEYKEVIRAVRKQVDEELKDDPNHGALGFCYIYWERVADLLKNQHGIIWRSPDEMNPWNCYD